MKRKQNTSKDIDCFLTHSNQEKKKKNEQNTFTSNLQSFGLKQIQFHINK